MTEAGEPDHGGVSEVHVAGNEAAAGPAPSVRLLECLGAVDSERRLQILDWLKDPTRHFRPQVDGDLVTDGVCGVLIAEKLGVSQPTVSEHMRVLVASGLVEARRIKQWTFYKRNEGAITAFKEAVRETL